MVETFAEVKTLGQFIARRRRDLGISQKEMAALLKNRDGEPLSSSYFNYLERDRGKPPDYLLDQMAEILKVGRDVLYFWAKRVPPDLEPGENVDPGRIAEAYQAFRRTLKGGGTGHGGNSVKKK
jgi:transcriptional regulator with XRE-family HTH domain